MQIIDRTGGPFDPEPGVEYAAVFVPPGTWRSTTGMRPFKLYRPQPDMIAIVDPDVEPNQVTIDGNAMPIRVLGRWDEPMTEQSEQTWQGYAAHQLGQVLRQRELVERLAKVGIQRAPEHYLPHKNTANAVERSLVLNYDEIDLILTKAGA